MTPLALEFEQSTERKRNLQKYQTWNSTVHSQLSVNMTLGYGTARLLNTLPVVNSNNRKIYHILQFQGPTLWLASTYFDGQDGLSLPHPSSPALSRICSDVWLSLVERSTETN
jgi:hypothetical protein